MTFPWVSRELYERVQEDLRRSQDERKELLDLLLQQSGVVPLKALAEALQDPASPEAESMVDKTTGALTIAGLRQMAQDAANRKAGRMA